MPSNQLPEDVKRAAAHELRIHLFGTDVPDDECDDCIDLITPLIIEWARKDQAEVDARIAKDGGTFWDAIQGQYRSLYPAEIEAAIRAQFTPETTGAPDDHQ